MNSVVLKQSGVRLFVDGNLTLMDAEMFEKIEIANCASVKCSEEQKRAVELVSSNVASISSGKIDGDMIFGIMGALGGVGDLVGMVKDAKMINADKYAM